MYIIIVFILTQTIIVVYVCVIANYEACGAIFLFEDQIQKRCYPCRHPTYKVDRASYKVL